MMRCCTVTDPGFVPGPGFERFLRDAENQMSKAEELKQRMAEVIGKGEAADGRITAEFQSVGGLTALDLDPRVLRLSSAELSLEIRAAVNAAAADFQQKLGQVSGELFGVTDETAQKLTDPKVALAEAEKLGNDFAVQMKDVLRDLTVQQQRAKGAMEQIRDPRQGF